MEALSLSPDDPDNQFKRIPGARYLKALYSIVISSREASAKQNIANTM